MYHSIQIGNRNTWNNWYLVPKQKPLFVPPTRKMRTIDVPGADGVVDLSNYPMGYPLYENRRGSWTFIVVDDSFYEGRQNNYNIYRLVEIIQNYIAGKKLQACLEDDPEYFYEGYFDVTGVEDTGLHKEITISYDVFPYKYYYTSSVKDLFNPFGATSGADIEHERSSFSIPVGKRYLIGFSDLDYEYDDEVYLDWKHFLGTMPLHPYLTITADREIYVNMHLEVSSSSKAQEYQETFQKGTTKRTWPIGIPKDVILYNSYFEIDNTRLMGATDTMIGVKIEVKKGML